MRKRNISLAIFFLVLLCLTAAAFFLEDRSSYGTRREFLTRTQVKKDKVSEIVFSEDGISAGEGAAVDGNTVLILSGGTYRLTGTSSDAGIIVMCRKQWVTLILDGLDLASSSGSPLFIYKSPLTVISLAMGSVNRLCDSSTYDFSDRWSSGSRNEPSAVIYSKKDVVIQGNGSLTLEGRYRDGIASLQSMGIFDGSVTISAPSCGIRAAGTVCGEDCYLTVTSGSDAVMTENDPERQYIDFDDCVLDLNGSPFA